MFDLLEKPTVWISVKWPGMAAGENETLGRRVEHEIEVHVEIVPRDEFRTLFVPENGQPADDVDIFNRVVSGWRKIVSGGKPVPFTKANVAKLLDVPHFVTGFARAYLQAWTNQVETREGNSESSPAAGPADEPEAETPRAQSKRASRRSRGNARISA